MVKILLLRVCKAQSALTCTNVFSSFRLRHPAPVSASNFQTYTIILTERYMVCGHKTTTHRYGCGTAAVVRSYAVSKVDNAIPCSPHRIRQARHAHHTWYGLSGLPWVPTPLCDHGVPFKYCSPELGTNYTNSKWISTWTGLQYLKGQELLWQQHETEEHQKNQYNKKRKKKKNKSPPPPVGEVADRPEREK